MIDSVVFRIHDLKKHTELRKLLDKSGVSGQGFGVKKYDDPVAAGEMFEKKIYLKQHFVDYEKGYTRDFVHRNHLPSHHGDLAYSIDSERNFIEFNFSIPKYLFGTNVFQFVPHHFDRDYGTIRMATIEQMADRVYDDLRKFLTWFFKKELGGLVNEYDVEINRLDICYNKMFNSQQDAQVYLNDLKRHKKKYERQNAESFRIYQTTIYYAPQTSGYTFKLYHKGTEFKTGGRNKKSDLSRLKKMGWEPELINKIQAFADRILRYEVEFKPKAMDTLFKRWIFRKDQDEWKRARRYYNSITTYGTVTIQKVKKTLSELDGFRKKCYRYGKFYMGKVFHFYMENDSALKLVSTETLQEFETGKFSFEREQRFTRELWKRMVDKFLEFKKEYTSTERNSFDQLLFDIGIAAVPEAKRDQHFRDYLFLRMGVKVKKISLRLCMTVAKFLKTHTWSMILEEGIVKRRQFFYLKKLFKQLGMENPASMILPVPDEKRGAFLEYHMAVESIVTAYYFRRFVRPF